MKTIRLELPATSANLGPGFDALALALGLSLQIEATEAAQFSIAARGRDWDLCAQLENNLLLETYREMLTVERRQVVPLSIQMNNGIPLGMGCGSSAAVRLAGVVLAVEFGSLGWSSSRIVETAARLEGHPDNVAACWHGGLTIAANHEGRLSTLSISPPPDWRAILVLPDSPVATSKARSVLPESYSRKDVVENIQNVALFTAAFALRKEEILHLATRDQLHQPYRAALCPLFPALSPLAGKNGVLSVTLSGAGPAVLLLLSGMENAAAIESEILERSRSTGSVEIVETGLSAEGASLSGGA
jgi:homoserine kinase